MKALYLSLSQPHHTYITYNILTYITEVAIFWRNSFSSFVSCCPDHAREIQREWFR